MDSACEDCAPSASDIGWLDKMAIGTLKVNAAPPPQEVCANRRARLALTPLSEHDAICAGDHTGEVTWGNKAGEAVAGAGVLGGQREQHG